MNYREFLDSKYQKMGDCGLLISKADIHPKLFEWQTSVGAVAEYHLARELGKEVYEQYLDEPMHLE